MLSFLLAAMTAQVPVDVPFIPMVPEPQDVKPWPSYAQLIAQAIRENRPLVVGIRCVPIIPNGYLGIQLDYVEPREPSSLAIGIPKNGTLHRLDLPPSSSVLDVRRAVEAWKGKVSREAAPFAEPDDSDPPWPVGLDKPYMIRYKRARFTQRIAVTNGRDSITPVPRTSLEMKWQVPGGTQGIQGVRSDLYKYVAPDSTRWIGDIPVWNGSNFQNNRGWKRELAPGSFYADVLSKDGVVFEVRYLDREKDRWVPHIAYRDHAARPAGYVSLKTRQCAECHQAAGTGGYATGLVSGGDFILSDPFPALER